MFFQPNGQLDSDFHKLYQPVLAYLDVYFPQYGWLISRPRQSICTIPMEEEKATEIRNALITEVDAVNVAAISIDKSTTETGKFRVWVNCLTFNLNPSKVPTIDKFELIVKFLNENHCPKLRPPFETQQKLEGQQVWETGISLDTPYLFYIGPERSIRYVTVSKIKEWHRYCDSVRNAVFYDFGPKEEVAGFTNKLIQQYENTLKTNEDKKVPLGTGYFYFLEGIFTDQLYYLAEKYYRKLHKNKPVPPIPKEKVAAKSAPQNPIPPGSAQMMQALGHRSNLLQPTANTPISSYPIYKKR